MNVLKRVWKTWCR